MYNVYDKLVDNNKNLESRYKIMNDYNFKPIYKLMCALGVPQEKQADFFEKYHVPDLIGEDCEVLFVLESPHTDEITHKHTLAGKSGKNLSKALIKADGDINKFITDGLNDDIPFGCWLKEHINNTDLGKKIGIMNVCNFPMQSKAYSCKEQNISELEDLNALKKDLQKSEQQLYCNTNNYKCFDLIMFSFKNRLTKLINNTANRTISIVCCGHIANNFTNFIQNNKMVKDPLQLKSPTVIKHPVNKLDQTDLNNITETFKAVIK